VTGCDCRKWCCSGKRNYCGENVEEYFHETSLIGLNKLRSRKLSLTFLTAIVLLEITARVAAKVISEKSKICSLAKYK